MAGFDEESFRLADRFGGPRMTSRYMVSPANIEVSRHLPRGA